MYKPNGIIHITGEPDTGKTTAALSAYHPKKTAYIFDDIKRPPINFSEFGFYLDLTTTYRNLKMLEFHQALMEKIDTLPEFDSIIFDTWSRFGKSIRYYAKANPFEFREQSTFSANGTIKNMEQWGEAHKVEAATISYLSQKCKALFLITHIKPQIVGGARTGAFEPDCGKTFDTACNARLWLRPNPAGVPIALVLKRIGKLEVSEKGVQPVNVLPRKLTPRKGDTSIWDVVNRYWDNPVGNREAQEGEIPTPFELSILDGVLTDDQKEMWKAELRAEQQREQEEKAFFENQLGEIGDKARELASKDYKNLPPLLAASHIIAFLQVDYPELTINEVVKMIS